MDMAHSREYLDYMASSAWQERRLAKLEQAKFRCKRCGARDGLEVHHLTYERLGREDTRDLIVLCKSCHWAADKGRPEPVTELAKRLIEKPEKPGRQLRSEFGLHKERAFVALQEHRAKMAARRPKEQ